MKTYHQALTERGIPDTNARLIEDIAAKAVQDAVEAAFKTLELITEPKDRTIALVVLYSMLAGHVQRTRDSIGMEIKGWVS